MDAALFQWFSAARAQSIPISGEILKAKAEELSKGLDPGLVLVAGSPDGKFAIISSVALFVGRMQL